MCVTCQLLENNSDEPIQYKKWRDYWSKVILEVIQVYVWVTKTKSLGLGEEIYLSGKEKLSLWANSSEGKDQGMTVTEYQD